MPFIEPNQIARTWSAPVTLTSNEDWVNRGSVTMLLTTSTPGGATSDEGYVLKPGDVAQLSTGDVVRVRLLDGGTAGGRVWREPRP